jgi:hypothetical protein
VVVESWQGQAAGAISVVGKAVLTLYPPLRPLSHNVNPRDGAQDIASPTGNKEWRKIEAGAFKRSSTSGSGHDAVISMYEHPTFPDGDGKTYMDLAKLCLLKEVLCLASTAVRRLLGNRGIFFDAVVVFPKEAFIFAVQALLEDHFLVDEQSIEDLRDRWYSNAQVTGSDMRAWVKMNAEVVAPWPRERTF